MGTVLYKNHTTFKVSEMRPLLIQCHFSQHITHHLSPGDQILHRPTPAGKTTVDRWSTCLRFSAICRIWRSAKPPKCGGVRGGGAKCQVSWDKRCGCFYILQGSKLRGSKQYEHMSTYTPKTKVQHTTGKGNSKKEPCSVFFKQWFKKNISSTGPGSLEDFSGMTKVCGSLGSLLFFRIEKRAFDSPWIPSVHGAVHLRKPKKQRPSTYDYDTEAQVLLMVALSPWVCQI